MERNMEKIETFDTWAVAITKVLELEENLLLVDKFIGNKKYVITLKQFYDTVMQHEGWQATIMQMGDYFCAQKLFYNGLHYTPQDIVTARNYVIDYFADFVVNAIVAGYEFTA